jgi:nicotinamide-nucleotide amidase
MEAIRMNAEIIAVGSELLLGQIVNTNARFLSERLAEIGVNVYFHTVVGDNPNRLQRVIEEAERRANLIIFTGGLGPTKDDLTKETIAKHLGKKLVMDEQALAVISSYFQKVKRPMTENNKKQALVLEGCRVLPNDVGMAPGMFLTHQGRSYMLLPGPPKEMEPMFTQYGLPAIKEQLQSNEQIVSRVLRFFGIGEAQLETEIADFIDQQSNPTIAPLAKDGEVTLRLTAKTTSLEEANRLIDEVEQMIRARVGKYLYGYNETSLMEQTVRQLKEQNCTIACAESLTAGLFQAELANISGVSEIFKGGVVCYSNEAKVNAVGVQKETIVNEGAVSEACAKELAERIREQFNATIGISFTGVAGPASLEGKPPGTVWIGISNKKEGTTAYQLQLVGNRNSIRSRAVKYGCYYLLKKLGK